VARGGQLADAFPAEETRAAGYEYLHLLDLPRFLSRVDAVIE